MLWHCPTTIHISGNLEISLEVGASVKKHLNSGVGSRDSMLRPPIAAFRDFRAEEPVLRHRILAELLDQGVRSALILPVHTPALTSQNLNALNQSTRLPGELDFARSAGINPSHALQHPGFYYYLAARCTEMRRERFQAAIEAEVSFRRSHRLSFGLEVFGMSAQLTTCDPVTGICEREES